MKKLRILFPILCAASLLASCGNTTTDTDTGSTTNPGGDDTGDTGGDSDTTIPDASVYDDIKENAITNVAYTNTTEETTVAIPTDAISISLVQDNTLEGDGFTVVDNVITITTSGNYVVSGTLTDGYLLVNKNVDVHLYLNGVSINSNSGDPLIFAKSDALSVITLVEDTTNELIDANLETYTSGLKDNGEYENEATIFAKRALTFNGTGILNVKSYYHEGIKTKGSNGVLKFLDGIYNVNSYDNGIKGNKNLFFIGGTFNVTTTNGDGVKTDEPDQADLLKYYEFDDTTSVGDDDMGYISRSETMANYNLYIGAIDLNIVSEFDGISAFNYIVVDNANIDVTTYDGYTNGSVVDALKDTDDEISAKGFKADMGLYVLSGDIKLNTADDGVNCNNLTFVDGGNMEVYAGDDGIQADIKLEVAAGNVDIKACTEGLEAEEINLTGGDISIVASDDGMNASSRNDETEAEKAQYHEECQMYFNGSTVYVNSACDGLDSNGSIEFNSGTVVVDGPTSDGDSALDSNGEIMVNGGTIIAGGSNGMIELPTTSSTQNVAGISLTASANSKIVVKDSSTSETVFTYTPQKQIKCMIISSSALTLNSTYDVYVDDTKTTSFTQSSVVTSDITTGNQGNPGVGGGQPGGNRP